MAYTSVTYADISSGTEVRRTEPKCPHISKLSKERLVGARKAPTVSSVPERLRPSRRCQKAPTVSSVPERLRPSRRCQKGSDRLVGARKAPTSRLKRRHTAATRGTALSIEASRLDRATDRCSCKRSPCTAHSQTGVVANVHHARRTARPVELQTFTMHGAQPDRWACHAHPVSRTGSTDPKSQHLKKKARRRAKPKPTTGAPRRRPAEGRSRRPASHAKRKVVGGAATTAGDRESSRMCPCCGGAR